MIELIILVGLSLSGVAFWVRFVQKNIKDPGVFRAIAGIVIGVSVLILVSYLFSGENSESKFVDHWEMRTKWEVNRDFLEGKSSNLEVNVYHGSFNWVATYVSKSGISDKDAELLLKDFIGSFKENSQENGDTVISFEEEHSITVFVKKYGESTWSFTHYSGVSGILSSLSERVPTKTECYLKALQLREDYKRKTP